MGRSHGRNVRAIGYSRGQYLVKVILDNYSVSQGRRQLVNVGCGHPSGNGGQGYTSQVGIICQICGWANHSAKYDWDIQKYACPLQYNESQRYKSFFFFLFSIDCSII